MTLFFTELQKPHKHKMFFCKPFRPIWTEKMTYISIPNLIHRSATLWGYCTPFFIQNNLNYYHMTQMWHIIYWIFVFKNLHCGENLQYFPYDKVPPHCRCCIFQYWLRLFLFNIHTFAQDWRWSYLRLP